MASQAMISGVILAGGASRRMGHDKALLPIEGQPLIARVAERLRTVASEVIIASGDGERYGTFGDRTVGDVHPGVGALGGIYSGLLAARQEWAFVVACDMPFLDPRVLAWFAAEALAAHDRDLVVLRHSLGVEPLHAVYRKSCLGPMVETIARGERCAFAFYDKLQIRYVEPLEIGFLDPDLAFLRNVNTPAQWRQATAGS